MKTFIQRYLAVKGHRENERFILKNLTTTKDAKIRKTRFGWTVSHSHGTKWLIEFADEIDYFYLDEEINDKGIVDYARYMYIYNEAGELIKEVVLGDIFASAYNTHKILTKD